MTLLETSSSRFLRTMLLFLVSVWTVLDNMWRLPLGKVILHDWYVFPNDLCSGTVTICKISTRHLTRLNYNQPVRCLALDWDFENDERLVVAVHDKLVVSTKGSYFVR